MSKYTKINEHKSLGDLPINLLRKAVRERRNRNEGPARKRRVHWKRLKTRPDEHDALLAKTQAELQAILAGSDVLSDIPFDCTPEELEGEIALARGEGTTIYIERDGLSTLTVVLPQIRPTIANLKRAIEATSRAQLKRELRERHEERLRRRRLNTHNATTTTTTTMTTASNFNSHDDAQQREQEEQQQREQNHKQRQKQVNKALEPPRSTGELVYSTARNGHQHRASVSWRFLWRAFALFDLNTNSPLDDENGRKLLSDCGIENASTLKFCKREAYFGRKRQ